MRRNSMINAGQGRAVLVVLLCGAGSLAWGQATDVECTGCVDGNDIANFTIGSNNLRPEAVTGSRIAPFAVSKDKIRKGAVIGDKLAPLAVSTDKIRGGAVTGEKIAPNAVGVTQIDPTQVQMRVGNSCAFGAFIAKIAEDGSPSCTTGAFGLQNTKYGANSLPSITTGSSNTANGFGALGANTSGVRNSAIGAHALSRNTTGGNNVAVGAFALAGPNSNHENTAVGTFALQVNSTGRGNTATGSGALSSNSGGNDNVAIGYRSLWKATGSGNISLGSQAGFNLVTGSNNIDIGNAGVDGDLGVVRIGDDAIHRSLYLAGVNVPLSGATLARAPSGQIGVLVSSRRYKNAIEDMEDVGERLSALRPVSFRYKPSEANPEPGLEYGLIAEEVAEVFPELVVYGEDNQPQTVKYQALSSLLLDEMQKQQRIIGEQASHLSALEGQLAQVTELKAELAELHVLVRQMASAQGLSSKEVLALNER